MRFLLGVLILSFGSSQAYIVSEQTIRTPDKQIIVLGDIHESVSQSKAHTKWLKNTCSQASTDTAFLLEDRAWEASYPPDGDTLHDFCLFTRNTKNNKANICASDMRPKWMIWVAMFAEDLQYAKDRVKKAWQTEKELVPMYGLAPQVQEYKNQLRKSLSTLDAKASSHINSELARCVKELKKLEQELQGLLPQKNISMVQAILSSKKQDRLLDVCQQIDIIYADAWFIINTLEALQTHKRVVVYIGQGHTGSVCKALKSTFEKAQWARRGSQQERSTSLPTPLDLTKCAWAQKPSLLSA